MSRHINKGNGFLKDKFGDFQADPPPEVWDTISGQLGGPRRRGIILISLSVAASLALAVTFGIHYFGRDIPHEIELAEDQGSSFQTGSPEEEDVSHIKDGVSSQALQSAGLEKKVVEAMAEAVPVKRINEHTLAMSEDMPESDAESDFLVEPEKIIKAEQGLKAEEDIKNSEVLVAEEGLKAEEDIKVSEVLVAEDGLKAGETDEEEKTADLILDAGEVGDEVMSDVVTAKDKDPRWVLGAMLSPLYSFRDAEPEALAGTSGQESGMISYATGVQVGYRATRRLALESGIIYNKMGLSIGAPGIQVFTQDDLDYAWGAPEIGASEVNAITNSVGNIVSHSGEIYVNNYKLNAGLESNMVDNVLTEVKNADQGIRQHLDYLELPFNLRYTILEGSFKIQVVGGMSTNLLVNNYVTMETASGTTEIGYLTNLRSVNYSGNAGVGFVYHLLEQLSLNVEPRFRYYLNSVNDATLPSTRPFTFGIYTGLNYFF